MWPLQTASFQAVAAERRLVRLRRELKMELEDQSEVRDGDGKATHHCFGKAMEIMKDPVVCLGTTSDAVPCKNMSLWHQDCGRHQPIMLHATLYLAIIIISYF